MDSVIPTLKSIGMYELISKTGFCITAALCYRFKPTQLFLKTKIGQQTLSYSHTNFPKGTIFMQDKTEKFANCIMSFNFVKKIPETLQLKGKRFGKSILEASVIYHLMIPFYAGVALKIANPTKN